MQLITDEEVKIVTEWGIKIGGVFISFVGGVATCAWYVKDIVDRVRKVEEAQKSCQSGPLTKIDEKLDYIIQEGLPDVHKRIDAVLLKDRKE